MPVLRGHTRKPLLSSFTGLGYLEEPMKQIIVLAASALMLTVLLPSDAEAQRRGYRAGGYRAVGARRVVVAGPRYRGVPYRRAYRPGLGVAAGALAVGAAAATVPYYYGGGYSYPAADPCLRQQQFWNGYGYQRQWVRVC
jgi:hypothetical protein